MSQDRLRKYMASMMNVCANTATLMSGNILQICSISCLFQLLSRIKSSACTEDYHPVWILLIRSETLIESLRCLMRDLCVICCGLTQMIELVGVFLQEAQVIHLDKTLQNNLFKRMD